MEDQLLIVKSIAFIVCDAIVSETLFALNETLRCLFYAMGILVLAFSLYDRYKDKITPKTKKDEKEN